MLAPDGWMRVAGSLLPMARPNIMPVMSRVVRDALFSPHTLLEYTKREGHLHPFHQASSVFIRLITLFYLQRACVNGEKQGG